MPGRMIGELASCKDCLLGFISTRERVSLLTGESEGSSLDATDAEETRPKKTEYKEYVYPGVHHV